MEALLHNGPSHFSCIDLLWRKIHQWRTKNVNKCILSVNKIKCMVYGIFSDKSRHEMLVVFYFLGVFRGKSSVLIPTTSGEWCGCIYIQAGGRLSCDSHTVDDRREVVLTGSLVQPLKPACMLYRNQHPLEGFNVTFVLELLSSPILSRFESTAPRLLKPTILNQEGKGGSFWRIHLTFPHLLKKVLFSNREVKVGFRSCTFFTISLPVEHLLQQRWCMHARRAKKVDVLEWHVIIDKQLLCFEPARLLYESSIDHLVFVFPLQQYL